MGTSSALETPPPPQKPRIMTLAQKEQCHATPLPESSPAEVPHRPQTRRKVLAHKRGTTPPRKIPGPILAPSPTPLPSHIPPPAPSPSPAASASAPRPILPAAQASTPALASSSFPPKECPSTLHEMMTRQRQMELEITKVKVEQEQLHRAERRRETLVRWKEQAAKLRETEFAKKIEEEEKRRGEKRTRKEVLIPRGEEECRARKKAPKKRALRKKRKQEEKERGKEKKKKEEKEREKGRKRRRMSSRPLRKKRGMKNSRKRGKTKREKRCKKKSPKKNR